ncbi:MAG: molybdopterin-dependent oxidoreductase [Nitrospina sp.]|jgi:NADH-quinone oxidoreductase chain G|nr:molybdopterin-dependent oxidoreductase [Nitrospina sp.]MBT6716422.1 molybdopterin-dependent oxidoreductase [Nitrospina sp.]
MSEVTLTIDGKSVTVPKGTKVVDAAKQVDVDIPVFCYHEKIGPLGCCRMCLVEVEKMPKLMTACTMDVAPDMVVTTVGDKVEKAQKGVLEFTLLNHPLDCPVCDKGGECPLQDNTFKYGPPDTRMEFHRANNVKAAPLSPVITIDRERCIACQRCTAYSERIEQDRGLVMLNRGFHNEVNTFNNEPYDNRFSGNVIDICPVGALTNTEFRFKARTWDLTNNDTLCAHCGCNCNITMGTRLNQLMRIEARPNDAVDDGWICDKGRWGHNFTESKNKIIAARENSVGETKPTSFPNFPIDAPTEHAAEKVAEAFKRIVDEHGAESVGFIGSPYATNEESYLYQKMFRLLGTNNIDHKTYQDTPGLPVDHFDIEQIESSNIVLLIASDPTEELPILDLRIKKAVSRCGTKLVSLNDQSTALDKYADLKVKYKVGSEASAVDALAEGLARELGESIEFSSVLDQTGISPDEMKSLVESVRSSMKICVIYNPSALSGDTTLRVKRLLSIIAKIPTVECGAIPAAPATNAVGAMDMGLVSDYYPGGVSVADEERVKELWGENAPTKAGLSALEMIAKAKSGEIKALLVHRANPVVDFPGEAQVVEALKNLDLLVVHDMLETETTQLAKIVLPSNGPGFDEGTTTNVGGRVQARRKALDANGIADWKLVSVMLKQLGDETNYARAAKVLDEISKKVPGYSELNNRIVGKLGCNREKVSVEEVSPGNAEPGAGNNGKLRLRVATYLFAHDKVLDASSKLAHHFKPSAAFLNESDAKNIGVGDGDTIRLSGNGIELDAEVTVDNRCLAGGVIVPRISDEQGVNGLTNFDGSSAWVDIKKV